MEELKVKSVKNSGIEIYTKGMTIYFSGSINHPRPGEFLKPFIQEVHSEIIKKNIKEIKVDIKDLKFLNSAGIRELVDWIMQLNELPEEKKYKILFICSSEQKWQESSILTLMYLNSKYLSKEVY